MPSTCAKQIVVVSGVADENLLFRVNRNGRPIGSTSGQPVTHRLAIVIDRIRLLRKGGWVIQAIRIDDGAKTRNPRREER